MKDTPINFMKRKDSGRYLKRYLPLSVIFRPALRHDSHLACISRKPIGKIHAVLLFTDVRQPQLDNLPYSYVM